ncbi:hypothetical protein Tco_1527143, partial [Tanacetum coccineum]
NGVNILKSIDEGPFQMGTFWETLAEGNKCPRSRTTSSLKAPSGHDESSSLYVELGLTDSESESDEEVPGINAGVQDEGHARPNPGDAATSQPPSSHVVLWKRISEKRTKN